MKDPVEWRMELAEDIAKRLCTFNGMQAIVVGGSVARGCADPGSDLDLFLFWDKMPEDGARQEIASALRADLLFSRLEAAGADRVVIQGFPVDLHHITVIDAERWLQRVLQEYDPAPEYSIFMEMIRTSVSLYGKQLVRTWKNRAALFPDELALNYIQCSIGNYVHPDLELMQKRGNPSAVYTYLVGQQQNVFHTLLGLNRSYFPSYKWMYHTLENMEIKPLDITGRFRAMFTNDPEEATADMMAIIGETLSLIEYTYPQIDLALTRIRISYARQIWEDPIYL